MKRTPVYSCTNKTCICFGRCKMQTSYSGKIPCDMCKQVQTAWMILEPVKKKARRVNE